MKFHDTISTITNLAFVAVGVIAFSYHWYVGITLIGLGFCSWMYHSQKTRFWRHADVISIYFVFLALINYLLPVDWWPVAFCIAGLLGIYHSDLRSHLAIGILGAITLIMCIISLPIPQTLTVVSLFAGWGILNLVWLNRDNLTAPYWLIDFSHSLTHIAAATGIYYIIA